MLRIAGVQFVGHADREANLATAERLVRDAAARGAKIACLPELFNTMYFCVDTKPEYFDWTAAVLGPDGRFIGKYRKSSIPFMDASRSPEPRGNEKYFFSPGDLGFPTFDTPFARIGILICYDRHFPEAARVLGLGGAEILFVPTATTRMTRYLWDVELRAHAIANAYYVCGVNKVGVDVGGSKRDHHGNSMIVSPKGEVLAEASATTDDIAMADVDLSTLPALRSLWGYYRDRRPDKYGPVVELPSGAVHPAAAARLTGTRWRAGGRPAPPPGASAGAG